MRKRWFGTFILPAALFWFLLPPVWAQEDPNAAFFNEVIVVSLQGRSISVLVTHKPGASKFKHAIALFPGSPGYGNLRMENGQVKIDKLGGNFLIRARRHFLADDVLTVVVDAPSDHQRNFPHSFRESERYGEDIKWCAQCGFETLRSNGMDFYRHERGLGQRRPRGADVVGENQPRRAYVVARQCELCGARRASIGCQEDLGSGALGSSQTRSLQVDAVLAGQKLRQRDAVAFGNGDR